MGRAPRRPGLDALAAVALAVTALVAVSASVASASWSRPVRFGGPSSLDVSPAQIGLSPSGAAAIAFGLENAESPASASAFLTTMTRGRIGKPRRVPGAQAILDLAYDGSALELLTGASPAGEACCSSAQTVRLSGKGAFSRPRTLVGGLTGPTVGRLVTVTGGGTLAAIGTDHGVWAAQAPKLDRFGPARRLTAAKDRPQAMAATSLANGHTAIAWTATSGPPGGPGPRSILIATGARSRAPQGRATAGTVPRGHQIDELAVAPGGSVATVAWIESWDDSAGRYHSQAVVENASGNARPRVFPTASQVASRLAFAADPRGDQVLAWEACDTAGACSVRAATRPAGGRFGAAASVGSIDPSQAPAATVGPTGQAMVGWISSGGALVVARGANAARFGPPRVLSRTTLTADLVLASSTNGEALAAWTEGAVLSSVMGAINQAR